jgi:uncharacterized membrane protein YqjE
VSAEPASGSLTEYWRLGAVQWQQQIRLLSLETRRAAASLLAIWLLTLVAAVLVAFGWGLVMLVLQQFWLSLGGAPWQGLALLLVLHLVLLMLVLRLIRFYGQFLLFPATRQSLHSDAEQAVDSSAVPTPAPKEPACPAKPL